MCQQIGHFICVLSAGDSRRIHSVPHPRAAACYGAGCSVCDGLIKVVCVSKSDILFVCCLQVTANSFTVYLIPETLRATVLGVKAVGDPVNIEVETQTQAIVDTVERVVAQYLSKSKPQ